MTAMSISKWDLRSRFKTSDEMRGQENGRRNSAAAEAGREPIEADRNAAAGNRVGGKIVSKGFTLLEVVISLFLIATTLLAVFRLQAQNLELQSEANFITTSRHLAQERISHLQKEKTLLEGVDSGDYSEVYTNFSYQTEVRMVPGWDNLYRVKVSIFQRQHTSIKEFSVETHLFK